MTYRPPGGHSKPLPHPVEDCTKLSDERGLYLEMPPSGGKWWRFKYRFGGKEKRLSLGVYPDVGLKEARERREDSRKILGNGIDPGEDRKAVKSASVIQAADSFEVITREWIGKNANVWAEGHYTRVVSLFERYVFPRIGARPIAEVTAPELLEIIRCIEKREAVASKVRGTDEKKPHIVPLSRQAQEILRELHPLTGNGRFVFPSARGNSRPMSDNAILAAMRRMGIEKDEMTGHGFRAVARTILDEVLKIRPDYIEHQLADNVLDPNGRAYNRAHFLPKRRQMMQQWAEYLDDLKAEEEVAHTSGHRLGES